MTESATLEHLNSMAQGEISACETYRQALEKIEEPGARAVLEKNHACHTKRVATLKEAVAKLGGEPAKDSGAWGAFAKMMEGGAKAFGDKAAVAVLEEGEDKGLKDYREMLEKVGSSSMISELLAAQENTHRAMSELKKSMA